MAQNCLRAHTAAMDGFGALKAMLHRMDTDKPFGHWQGRHGFLPST